MGEGRPLHLLLSPLQPLGKELFQGWNDLWNSGWTFVHLIIVMERGFLFTPLEARLATYF